MPPTRRGGKGFSMGLATSDSEVAEFLEQCKVSGDNAYNAIKGVLERLHNPETRVSARQLLAAVEKYVEKQGPGLNSMSTYHFRIHQLSLTDYEGWLHEFLMNFMLCVSFYSAMREREREYVYVRID